MSNRFRFGRKLRLNLRLTGRSGSRKAVRMARELMTGGRRFDFCWQHTIFPTDCWVTPPGHCPTLDGNIQVPGIIGSKWLTCSAVWQKCGAAARDRSYAHAWESNGLPDQRIFQALAGEGAEGSRPLMIPPSFKYLRTFKSKTRLTPTILGGTLETDEYH